VNGFLLVRVLLNVNGFLLVRLLLNVNGILLSKGTLKCEWDLII
jgi:hypothetical protein